MSRRVLVTSALIVILVLLFSGGIGYMISMPGESYDGKLPALTEEQQRLKRNLRDHVRTLAGTIGERNIGRTPDALKQAARYIEEEFESMGYNPSSHPYEVDDERVRNVWVRLGGPGEDRARLVVGAHYDSVEGSPGANDNGTGVAALLELARLFSKTSPERPIDFVAFVNEEPPYFTTEDMGSARYARRLSRKNVDVKAMISLETIGYYREDSGSQNYPFPFNFFYPDRGTFIGFVGNLWYRKVVREGIKAFRNNVKFPSQGVAAPGFVPGIGWSDHRSFWQYGYPAFMITDTALYRYPHYHRPSDTPDKVDYDNLTRVTLGIKEVLETLQRTANRK